MWACGFLVLSAWVFFSHKKCWTVLSLSSQKTKTEAVFWERLHAQNPSNLETRWCHHPLDVSSPKHCGSLSQVPAHGKPDRKKGCAIQATPAADSCWETACTLLQISSLSAEGSFMTSPGCVPPSKDRQDPVEMALGMPVWSMSWQTGSWECAGAQLGSPPCCCSTSARTWQLLFTSIRHKQPMSGFRK